MTVKVHVLYASDDGTVQEYPVIEGPYIHTQHFDGGRAIVTVRTKRHGHIIRSVQFLNAVCIDREFSDDHYTA